LKLLTLWGFFLRPALLVGLVALPWVLRDRWMKLAAIAVGAELAAILCETFMNLHYFAPAVGLMMLLVVRSLELLRTVKRGDARFGRVVLQGILATVLLSLWLGARAHLSTPLEKLDVTYQKAKEREDLVHELKMMGGKHLMLVEYGPEHSYLFEWVYNDADIDRANIVWARPMTPEKTAVLVDYFADREVWILSADAQPCQLRKFKREPAAKAPPTDVIRPGDSL
jgi:hypothetical protein